MTESPMSSGKSSTLVWLAMEFQDFQGCQLLGVYTTKEAAEARLSEVPKSRRQLLGAALDEPMDEWLGG